MHKTKPASIVIPVRGRTVPRTKTDAVFAMTKRGRGYRKVRVSEWMSYAEAIERYSRLEAYNTRNTVLHNDPKLGAGGGPIIYLAVRSSQDPNWNKAPRCTAVVRNDKKAVKARASQRAI